MTDRQINFLKLLEFEPYLLNGDTVEVIVKYTGDILKYEREYNVDVEILSCNFAIVTGLASDIAILYELPDIEYIELPISLNYELESQLNFTCVSPVFRAPYNLSGKGTLFALIDSGLDFTHPDFIDENGNTRIISIWDQTTNGNPPEKFSFGTQYSEEEINAALKGDSPLDILPFTDEIGHGTAVCGIAVGNGRSSGGREKGVAPNADIVVVKLGLQGQNNSAKSTEIMRAFRYVTDIAEEKSLPLSINLSYGTNNGGHNGKTLFEEFINDICSEWKVSVSVATGNEGTASHHYSAIIQNNVKTNADFTILNTRKKMYISVIKNFIDTMDFKIVSPNGMSSFEMRSTMPIFSFSLDGVNITAIFNTPTNYNLYQEIYFLFESESDFLPNGLWQIVITGVDITDGKIDFWLPTTESVTSSTKFLTPDVNTTLTIPSTAENVITVGGVDSSNNAFASFSGRGFTVNNNIKPDICAPAVSVLTTKKGGGYDVYSGTSLASPFVAGACLIMMEWGIVEKNDRFLFGQKIKAFLQKGANRMSGITYPDRRLGYGTLCLQKTIDLLIEYDKRGILN